jgi:hypothetical protein
MRALGTKSTAGSYAMCSDQLFFFRNAGTHSRYEEHDGGARNQKHSGQLRNV